MIKLKQCKPQGYIITFTRYKEWFFSDPERIPITNSEAKALYKLLRKHFIRYEINRYRKKAGQKPYKFDKKGGVKI